MAKSHKSTGFFLGHDSTDEKQSLETQKKVLTRWINYQLAKGFEDPGTRLQVSDLYTDLRDGARLFCLVCYLTANPVPEAGHVASSSESDAKRLIERSKQLMQDNFRVDLSRLDTDQVLQGRPKATLALVWTVLQAWYSDDSESSLLEWCQERCRGYPGVHIANLTVSWKDGLGFLAILHSARSDLLVFNERLKKTPADNLALAFHLGNTEFGVPSLLDVDDLLLSATPDKKSVSVYLLLMRENVFASENQSPTSSPLAAEAPLAVGGATTKAGADVLAKPAEDVIKQAAQQQQQQQQLPLLRDYQHSLERCLEWLFDAEDLVATASDEPEDDGAAAEDEPDDLTAAEPVAESDLTAVRTARRQYRDHEGVADQLTENQEDVRCVLELADALLSSPEVSPAARKEIQSQVQLLQSRWDALREAAVAKEARLRRRLAKLQERDIRRLSAFLHWAEARIEEETVAGVGPFVEDIKRQLRAHREFQDSLEVQEALVASVQDALVLDADANGESGTETRIEALAARWTDTMAFNSERFSDLQSALLAWRQFEEDESLLRDVVFSSDTQEAKVKSLSGCVRKLETTAEEVTAACHDNPKCVDALRDKLAKWKAGNFGDLRPVMPISAGDGAASAEDKDSADSIVDDLNYKVRSLLDWFDRIESMLELTSLTHSARSSLMEASRRSLHHQQQETTSGASGDAAEKLSADQHRLLLDDIRDELNVWEPRLVAVRQLGDSCISQGRVPAESASEIQELLEEIEQRWSELSAVWHDCQRRAAVADRVRGFYECLTLLRVTLNRQREFLQSAAGQVGGQLAPLAEAAAERLAEMKDSDSQYRDLATRLSELQCSLGSSGSSAAEASASSAAAATAVSSSTGEPASRTQQLVERDYTEFSAEWLATFDALAELHKRASREQRDPLWRLIGETEAWCDEVAQLLRRPIAVATDEDTGEEAAVGGGGGGLSERHRHLTSLVALLQRRGGESVARLEALAADSSQPERQTAAGALIRRLSDLASRAESRAKFVGDLVAKRAKLCSLLQELENWTMDMNEFANTLALVRVESRADLKSQIAELDAAIADVSALAPKASAARDLVSELAAYCEEQYGAALSARSETVASGLVPVQLRLEDRRAELNARLENFDALRSVEAWCESGESRLAAAASRSSAAGSQQQTKTRSVSTSDLSNSGQLAAELAETGRGHLANHGDKMPASLKSRVQTIIDEAGQLASRRRADVITAVHSFHSLLKLEKDWIRKANRQVDSSMSREHLDAEDYCTDLERLEAVNTSYEDEVSSYRREQLRSLAESLNSVNEDSSSSGAPPAVSGATAAAAASNSADEAAVEAEEPSSESVELEAKKALQSFQDYTRELNSTKQRIDDRMEILSSSLDSIQELERRTNAMQDWLPVAEDFMANKMEAELLAADCPAEAETLRVEIDQHNQTLKLLDETYDRHMSSGNRDAALRLEGVRDSLRASFDYVAKLFNRFQRPADFEPKLDRVRRELESLNDRLHLLDLLSIEPEDVQRTKEFAEGVSALLAELQPDLQYVVATGKQLVEQKQVDFPKRLLAELTRLEGMFDRLSEQVQPALDKLAQALPLVESLDAELQQLRSWLEAAEEFLHPTATEEEQDNGTQQEEQQKQSLQQQSEICHDLKRRLDSLADQTIPAILQRVEALGDLTEDLPPVTDAFEDIEQLIVQFETKKFAIETRVSDLDFDMEQQQQQQQHEQQKFHERKESEATSADVEEVPADEDAGYIDDDELSASAAAAMAKLDDIGCRISEIEGLVEELLANKNSDEADEAAPIDPKVISNLQLELSEVRSRVGEVRDAAASLIGGSSAAAAATAVHHSSPTAKQPPPQQPIGSSTTPADVSEAAAVALDRLDSVDRKLASLLTSNQPTAAVEEESIAPQQSVAAHNQAPSSIPQSPSSSIAIAKERLGGIRGQIEDLVRGAQLMRESLANVTGTAQIRVQAEFFRGQIGLISADISATVTEFNSAYPDAANGSDSDVGGAGGGGGSDGWVSPNILPPSVLSYRHELLQLQSFWRDKIAYLEKEVSFFNSTHQLATELASLQELAATGQQPSERRISSLSEQLQRRGFRDLACLNWRPPPQQHQPSAVEDPSDSARSSVGRIRATADNQRDRLAGELKQRLHRLTDAVGQRFPRSARSRTSSGGSASATAADLPVVQQQASIDLPSSAMSVANGADLVDELKACETAFSDANHLFTTTQLFNLSSQLDRCKKMLASAGSGSVASTPTQSIRSLPSAAAAAAAAAAVNSGVCSQQQLDDLSSECDALLAWLSRAHATVEAGAERHTNRQLLLADDLAGHRRLLTELGGVQTGLETEGVRVSELLAACERLASSAVASGGHGWRQQQQQVSAFKEKADKIGSQYSQLQLTVAERQLALESDICSLEAFQASLDDLESWIANQLVSTPTSQVGDMSSEQRLALVDISPADWSDRETEYRLLAERYSAMLDSKDNSEEKNRDGSVSESLRSRMRSLASDWLRLAAMYTEANLSAPSATRPDTVSVQKAQPVSSAGAQPPHPPARSSSSASPSPVFDPQALHHLAAWLEKIHNFLKNQRITIGKLPDCDDSDLSRQSIASMNSLSPNDALVKVKNYINELDSRRDGLREVKALLRRKPNFPYNTQVSSVVSSWEAAESGLHQRRIAMEEAAIELRQWEQNCQHLESLLDCLPVDSTGLDDLDNQLAVAIDSGSQLCVKHSKENTEPMRDRLDRLRQARSRLADRRRQHQQQQQSKQPPKPPPHRRSDAPPTPPVRQSSRERVAGSLASASSQQPVSMEAIGRLDKSEARLRHWEVSLPLTPLQEHPASAGVDANDEGYDEAGTNAPSDPADELTELNEEERRLAAQLKDFDSECELATAELQLLVAHHQHQQSVCNRANNLQHRWSQLSQQRAAPLGRDLRRRQHSRRRRRSQSQALQVRVRSLVDWLATAEAALRQQQLLLGGDAESIRSEQTPELDRLANELRSRRPELESVLTDAEQQPGGVLDNRLNRSIGQLDRRFRELESRIESHAESLRLALHGLAALEDTAAQAEAAASAAQREVAAWSSVDSLSPAQCASEPTRLQEFLGGTLEPLTRLSGSLERQSHQLADARVVFNHDLASRLANIRQQVLGMRSAIEHRCGLLANLREQQQQQQQQQQQEQQQQRLQQQQQSLVPNVMTASYASMTGSVHSEQPQPQPQQQQKQQQATHPAVANSVRPPWQRMLHPNGSQLPYYRNADTRETSWDHPIMAELMQSLTELNYIRYAAYRTAAKLRRLQRALYLDLVSLGSAAEVFRDHGIGTAASGDRLIDVTQMTSCLAGLFARCRTRGGGGGGGAGGGAASDAGLQAQTIDLSLNWLLNVYDHVRSGRLRVLSFKVGLVLLCAAGLEDKYRYLFSAVVDERGALDQRRLGLLLHDCLQVPRHLGEAASFGGSNIEPSVRSCFDKATGQAPAGLSRAESRRYRRMPLDLHRQLANELRAIVDADDEAQLDTQSSGIRLSHFLAWLRLEPQSIVWLPVLHRLTCSEHSLHQARCSSCKAMPMRGLRYKCLKCFNLNLCQQCFFSGRSARHHKVTHPMQEYVRPPGSGDGLRSLSRTLRNKLRIGGHGSGGASGSLGGRGGSDLTDAGAAAGGSRGGSPAKLGYLPVQTVREGQAIESPAGSPAHNSSRDMHNRVEAYASRLAEVEQQQQQLQQSQKLQQQPPPPPASPLPQKIPPTAGTTAATATTTQPLQHSFPGGDRNSPQQKQQLHSRTASLADHQFAVTTTAATGVASDDEHALIAAYTGTLRQRQNAIATTVGTAAAAAAAAIASSAPMLPQSPQPLQHFSLPPDRSEQMRELEAQNRRLQAEYERLKTDTSAQRMQQQQLQQQLLASPLTPVRSMAAPPPPASSSPSSSSTAAAAAAEARLLRAHKGRLEARMTLLEDHNKQLESQLTRLRRLLAQSSQSPSPSPQHHAMLHQYQQQQPPLAQTLPTGGRPQHPHHQRAGSSGCVSDSESTLPSAQHQYSSYLGTPTHQYPQQQQLHHYLPGQQQRHLPYLQHQQQQPQLHQYPMQSSASASATPASVLLRHGGSARFVGGMSSSGAPGGGGGSESDSASLYGSLTRNGCLADSCPTSVGRNSVSSLFAMAGQVSSAMGQLVDVMNRDSTVGGAAGYATDNN